MLPIQAVATTLLSCFNRSPGLQIHGGAGVSQDVVLGHLFATARTLLSVPTCTVAAAIDSACRSTVGLV
jgi:hypothetical protein